MELEDMILISVDDHVVEPPDMWEGRVPKKYADQVPKLSPWTTGPRRGSSTASGHQHRAQRRRRPSPGGLWTRRSGVRRHAPGLLRRTRAGPRHERQWGPRHR